MKANDFPFDSQQSLIIEQLFESLDVSKLYWLHGYIQALIQSRVDKPAKQIPEKPQITVLFGTHTGNSRKIAVKLHQQLEEAGHAARITDIADFKGRDIKSEKVLLLIISTHGEGQPPLAAEDFYEYLHSNRPPALSDLSYAILGLGDKSYFHFCKTGADFDLRFEQLGANRLLPRLECDVDYGKASEQWMKDILQSLSHLASNVPLTGKSEIIRPSVVLPTRENPIEAIVLDKIKLTGRNSEKNTYHIELQLPSEQMIYEPGDSVGIIPGNNQSLVGEIIHLLKAVPEMPVVFENSSGSLGNILAQEVELTKLTRENLEKYNEKAGNKELTLLTQDLNQLSRFLFGSTWADVLRLYPGNISAEDFLSMVRSIQPRLYSISSSARANPGEVHLTVSQLNYHLHGLSHQGICSTYLSELPENQEKIRMFFEANDVFRLPSHDTDIIMIGPGTGVAPFRAFMQDREDAGATGKNWLFFGDQRFTADFLYQTEWQEWHRKSLLHRIDLAFSRDQQHKIYVQHRLLEKSRDVYGWLENGAKIYVCGDMKRMSPDVHRTFVEIVSREGGISIEKAQDYVKTLRKQKRYLEDVY
ncbi:MAG TPA: assimilatory sulfite reductase (NADPH) flavoprotein subunit [Bacteroidales bacterium]|nr:assimilatory sulfite reductase (NADPH) flavoprotein subunit [Bacteroidales bacterium]